MVAISFSQPRYSARYRKAGGQSSPLPSRLPTRSVRRTAWVLIIAEVTTGEGGAEIRNQISAMVGILTPTLLIVVLCNYYNLCYFALRMLPLLISLYNYYFFIIVVVFTIIIISILLFLLNK